MGASTVTVLVGSARRALAAPIAALAAMVVAGCLGDRPTPLAEVGGEGGSEAGAETGTEAGLPVGGDATVEASEPDGAPFDASTADADAASESGNSGGVGVPAKLAFAVQPKTTAPGAPIPSSFVVAVEDSAGTLVPSATNQTTLAIGHNPGGANLLGIPTAAANAGYVTFPPVGLDQPGTGYTLIASSPGLASAESNPFDSVTPAFAPVTTGLYGGTTYIIVAGGGAQPALYVSTNGGVYRSMDSGGTWTLADFGNPNSPAGLVIDPTNSSTVYSLGATIAKSTNRGNTWRNLAASGCFAVDPVNPSILYAASGTGVRALRSTDGGDSWVQFGFSFGCAGLVIDPVTPSTLYALVPSTTNEYASAIYKSVNSGANWGPIGAGVLPSPASLEAVFATPTGVFLSVVPNSLLRSTDGGATWTQPAGGQGSGSVVYAPSNVMRIYLGTHNALDGTVLISNDGGATFGSPIPIAVGSGGVQSLAVDPANADRVYAATAKAGVYASSDGGKTWAPSSTGISLLTLSSVAMSPAAPSTIFLGGPNGVYRTTDAGVTWTATPFAENDPVTALAIDPANSNNVYACSAATRFYGSHDGGATWGAAVATGGTSFCDGIAVHGSTLWVPTAGGGIRRSTDGGATWTATGLTMQSSGVAVDPTGMNVYAATSAGTYKSTDGGVTWAVMVPTDLAAAILVDPLTPTTVYAGMSCATSSTTDASGAGGIKRSLDSGATWSAPAGSGCITGLLGLPDGTLFAAGVPYLETSTDHGVTWKSSYTPQVVPAVQVNPGNIESSNGLAASSDAKTLYMATGRGLYKSVTGGL